MKGAACLIALALAGCPRGELTFDDLESRRPLNEGRFAVGDSISARITASRSLGELVAASSNPGVLAVEPGLVSDGDGLLLSARIVGEGGADIELRDRAGDLVAALPIEAASAAALSVAPLQFGGAGAPVGAEGLRVFAGGEVPLLTGLRDDADALKGQLAGAVSSAGEGVVSLAAAGEPPLLGELFGGPLNLSPVPSFTLAGLSAGESDAVTAEVTGGPIAAFPVAVVAPDDPGVRLVVVAPGVNDGPQRTGLISATAFQGDDPEAAEVLGGSYAFTEVDGDRVIFTQSFPDAVRFVSRDDGFARVRVDRLDGARVLESVTVVFQAFEPGEEEE